MLILCGYHLRYIYIYGDRMYRPKRLCVCASIHALDYSSPTFLPNTIHGWAENKNRKKVTREHWLACGIISHGTSCVYGGWCVMYGRTKRASALLRLVLERICDFVFFSRKVGSEWRGAADARMPNTGIINDWHMAVAKIVSARERMNGKYRDSAEVEPGEWEREGLFKKKLLRKSSLFLCAEYSLVYHRCISLR